MVDERLLAPIRRFWTEEEVSTAYQTIFNAYSSRLADVTVIVGKGTEGDNVTGQVVVGSEDYLGWMDALETRLQELASEAMGEKAVLPGTEHVNFGSRYVST